MNINGKWYTETELAAYIKELEEKLHDRDLEADNGARQIAHYDDELRRAKELLKAAVEDIKYLINHAERNGKACDRCKYGNEMYCYADDCSNDAKWQHEDEALALIEGGRDVYAKKKKEDEQNEEQ
ncbi:MAG: hypothetical protein IJM44_03675 [Ruminococcus sp.]|nr:hypothetical protein [Ruminococcus sp.]